MRGCDLLQTRVRMPRLHPPNFALLCDWVLWDVDDPWIGSREPPGLIYVRSDPRTLALFTGFLLPRLRHPFVLVTSSHDLPMPLGFARRFGFDWRRVVENPLLRGWFTENRDVLHEKVHALPLGLPAPDLRSWLADPGTPARWDEELLASLPALRQARRDPRILGCWHSRTGHPSGTCPPEDDERQSALDVLGGQREIFAWRSPGIAHRELVELMGRHEFVLCPHGGGLDPCPRLWEALLLRAIPIVRRNTTTDGLRRLPVAVVEAWEEITPARLAAWRDELRPRVDEPRLDGLMTNETFLDDCRRARSS